MINKMKSVAREQVLSTTTNKSWKKIHLRAKHDKTCMDLTDATWDIKYFLSPVLTFGLKESSVNIPHLYSCISLHAEKGAS